MPADGSTLLDRLRALFPEASTTSLHQWLRDGRVRVNGAVKRDGRAAVGARDRVGLGATASRMPFPAALRLVHEDADLLVIDKPPGLLTIATDRERERTAYRMLWSYLGAGRPPQRPFIVHRLDRETSGLLVVAKTPAAKRILQEQFEARSVERVYVALVEGRVREDHGTLVAQLAQDRGLRVRAARDGKEAITHYRVLERDAAVTLLELTLGTGRRQQIRVQLAGLGHPIVGDARHGSARSPIGRLCLHATRLGFVHPRSGAAMRFESPAPAAFSRVGRAL
ncbi:MAG: RluA family pseudouridine synthase [Candidatus Rokubacteria bacterium]|nr:RluA family pseudouridine synthase [Candidatus Rokubacteria bacterium]